MFPIKELIAQNLLDVLNGVKSKAGFLTDLSAEAADELSNVPGDSSCVLHETDARLEENPSLGHDGYYQPYIVRAWGVESQDAGDTPEKRLSIVSADIIRAIMLDPHRGGKAHNSFIRGVKSYPQNSPPAVDVNVEVFYRTLKNDPYRQ